ncbi:YcaO-like family protein [Flavobacterium sp. CS20]|uniref:YcaO-like family protein n=1 Tax=Flavobacterium sp. CS20 TaxID=2775246 RepID=UPI001B39F6A4|nr:YcaO-like family protein [Flavobacterium sp. CS20]QTY27131.1 YcaO-like family protein [Flavobacterium sp. CS20]
MARDNLSIEDLFSRVTGLVNFIAETENSLLDPDVFVLASDLCDTSKIGFSNNMGSNGSGAGLTYNDAYYSTLGECAERYALSVIDKRCLVFGSYEKLHKKYDLINPDDWNLFSDNQFLSIPFKKFTKKSLISWVLSSDLLNKKEIYVPACSVYLPFKRSFEEKGEVVLYPSVSTGASCDGNFNYAILKGIYELIERDAFMICWRNKLKIPRLIIDENSKLFDTYIKNFKRKNLRYELFYTKMDLDVHSVFGLVYKTDNDLNENPEVYCGGACHHDINIAVKKTLLEMVQGLKWGEFSKDEIFKVKDDFSNINSFKDRMLLYSTGDFNHVFEFLYNGPKLNISDLENENMNSVNDNLKHIFKELSNNDLDCYACDVTSVDIKQCELNVVKILIPQFETMEGDFRFPFLGNSRYKKIPKKLGLKTEENIFPHPYP